MSATVEAPPPLSPQLSPRPAPSKPAARQALRALLTPHRLRLVRFMAVAAWAVALVLDSYAGGIHFDRTGQLLWLALGLLAASIGRRRFWYVLLDFAPFGAVLTAYDLLRGASDRIGMPTWWTPQIDVDKFLFLGHEPNIWLQERLKYPSVQWWDVLVCACYLSFFFLPYITAAVLWLRHRGDFYRWGGRFVALSFAGFVVFALFPAAPPWAAATCTAADVSGHPNNPACLNEGAHSVAHNLLGSMVSVHAGAKPFLERLSLKGWGDLHLSVAAALVKEGQAAVDQVAAVPSLHAGGTVLFALFMWRRVNRWWRALLAVYPVAMAFSLVYSAEHYVSDVLAGWLLAVVVHVAAGRFETRREWRHAPDTLEPPNEPKREPPCLPTSPLPETTPSSI